MKTHIKVSGQRYENPMRLGTQRQRQPALFKQHPRSIYERRSDRRSTQKDAEKNQILLCVGGMEFPALAGVAVSVFSLAYFCAHLDARSMDF